MNTTSSSTIFLRVALATGTLLLIPALAMQFTNEFSWGWVDFLLAGALLFIAGTAIAFAAMRLGRPAQRYSVVLAIVGVAALVWAELAVGLFH